MKYCPDCGTGHECENETGREKAEVAITRLTTQRDIEVARINAQAGVKIADSEATQAAAHAEGVEEGIGAVLDAASPDAPPAGETPLIVQADAPGPEPELEPEMAPPPVGVPAAEESGGSGWWDGYR